MRLVLVMWLLLQPPMAAQAPPAQTRVVLAMGTSFRLELPAEDAERAIAEVARVESFGSTWRKDTVLSRLGAEPGTWISMTPEVLNLLKEVATWCEKTQGAFEPVLAALVQAHGLRSGGRASTAAERASALDRTGIRHLEVDAPRRRARLLTPGAGIEEGGFLKGYALDQARLAARTPAGLLDFGGQLLAWGPAVPASVADPSDRQRPRLQVRLENASLSTSGCSERGRHILDPRTGEACPAWGSVSVIHASALVADILSTALYVMGPTEGLSWARAHGVAAAFLPLGGPWRLSPAFAALHPLLLER